MKGKILELRNHKVGDGCAQRECEAKIGVWRDPEEFLLESCHIMHPFDLFPSVPDNMRRSVFLRLTRGCVHFARSQLVSLQRLRDIDHSMRMEEAGLRAGMHQQVKNILGQKSVMLFGKLCKDAGWGDATLSQDMSEGFPLVGTMRQSGMFERRTVPASLSLEELRAQAVWVRKSARDCLQKLWGCKC